MTKRPFRPLAGHNQMPPTQYNQSWLSFAKSRDIEEPSNTPEHGMVEGTSKSQNKNNYYLYKNSSHLSSGQLSTEGLYDTKISISAHALLRYAEHARVLNVASVRRGLATVLRGNCCRGPGCQYHRVNTTLRHVSDLTVLAFLLQTEPGTIAALTAELEEKLRHFSAWRIRDFVPGDAAARLRLVIRDRTLVTVIPRRTKARRRAR